jgi:hypothetical protein
MTCTFDRIDNLLNQGTVTGVDYVYVDGNQTTLNVHFHMKEATPPATPGDILSGLTLEQIVIYPSQLDVSQGNIPITDMQWIESNTVLELTTVYPGGFANYNLYINDSRVDRKFNDVTFNFKANCESKLDCKPLEHECPEEDEVDFQVDYQARDFWSFRRALLDFASLRYPDWQDRLEADAGIMLVEMMSALGDEFSYYQDRIAREAFLETASQRRSLRHHARLVDYEIHDGMAASTWLDITVKVGQSGNIDAGSDVWAVADDGQSIYFEIGRGLADILNQEKFFVDAKINSLSPHTWDEDDICLATGATELYIDGWHKTDLSFNDVTADDLPCRWMLLQTTPVNPAIVERRWLVCVIDIQEEEDLLVDSPGADCDKFVTRLVWQQQQALPFEMDLTTLEVRGNMVPATAGRLDERLFVVGADIEDLIPALPADQQSTVTRTVERCGADGSIMHLFSLPSSDEIPLCWLGEAARNATPEVKVWEMQWDGSQWQDVPGGEWDWTRSFLGEYASQADDEHFTLEDGVWRRVVGYRRSGKEVVHIDYAGNRGTTIRFGDNQFGRVPDDKVFKVAYRLGNGRIGNVAADTLVQFNKGDKATPAEQLMWSIVSCVRNPLPAVNGTDPETAEEVKQLAPEAFRAVTYRAVREEDYREAAQRLDWVQRAGAQMRWTGSWMTTFVTPDPKGAVTLSEERHKALATQMDRFRQAGREAIVAEPRYADIDLKITVCVQPYTYPGQVQASVLKALVGKGKTPGFFSADHFTFGTPLRRSQLEAAIQQVPGVRAVGAIQIRRRGHFDWQLLTGPYQPVGDQQVLRLENDPDYPERGTLELIMEGGA